MKEMLIGLIQNIAILFAFGMLYENFWLKHTSSKSLKYKFISGIILGVIGIVLMFTPWIMVPGIAFDSRTIMLSLSGLFFGPIPTIIAMLITGSLRVMIGGEGIWMGLAVIVSSGIIGLLWRTYRPSWREKNIFIELFSFGVIVHLIMLGFTLILPANEIIPVIKAIVVPVFVIYTPGTLLIGYLLLRQSNNFQNSLAKEKLVESDRRLAQILKSGNIASVILDTYGKIVFCNKYLLGITQYTEEEVINKFWFDLFIPLYLRDDLRSVFDEAMKGMKDSGQNENEIIAKNGKSIFISWHFTHLQNEKNEVTGIVCIGVNITERIEYELKLIDRNKEIETQNIEYQENEEEYLQMNEELRITNAELREKSKKN
jgi:PAS domain S-box-containing protein